MKKYLIITPVLIGLCKPAFPLSADINPGSQIKVTCCTGCTALSASACKLSCPNCPTELCCPGCYATAGFCSAQCATQCGGSSDCTKVNAYCSAGTYCNSDTKACTACPSPGTSSGTLGRFMPITKCYIPSGTTFKDIKGSGEYVNDCYYDDTPIVILPGSGEELTPRP